MPEIALATLPDFTGWRVSEARDWLEGHAPEIVVELVETGPPARRAPAPGKPGRGKRVERQPRPELCFGEARVLRSRHGATGIELLMAREQVLAEESLF